MDGRPRLLDQVRDHLRTLHCSFRTERQHLFWVRQVSASTQNQALAALLGLHQRVLQVDLPWLDGVRACRADALPAGRAHAG
jgi:hypothetical protein